MSQINVYGAGGGGGGTLDSLTGNTGGPVFPSGANINIVGDGTTITSVGDPSTHTITFSVINGGGAIQTIDGDVGSVTGQTVSFNGAGSGSSVLFSGSSTTMLFNVTDSGSNTIIGSTAGNSSLTGAANTGLGKVVFHALTNGNNNVALGYQSAEKLTSGVGNTSIGYEALTSLLTGNFNIAIGNSAGAAYTGSESSNIMIGSSGTGLGTVGESNTLRIGLGTGSATYQLNKAFISGINGITSSTADQVLLVNSSNQVVSIAHGTSGTVLTSAGAGANPTWSAIPSSSISITGDTGGALTGNAFTFDAISQAGSSVSFSGSGTTQSLNTTDSLNNTIIGKGAGNSSYSGSANTGLGLDVLTGLTSGTDNLALGETSLNLVTSGAGNVGLGSYTLGQLLTGVGNICIGSSAGYPYTGAESGNIVIGGSNAGLGTVGESNVLRIGGGTGTGNGQINAAYISGITGIMVTGTAVLVSATNQLGIAVSSAKYKENIKDMGSASDNVLILKPKTFTYKQSTETRYGLIAEEVAQVYPNLVVYDKNGDPQTVMYQELPALLLNELKKALNRIEFLEKKLSI